MRGMLCVAAALAALAGTAHAQPAAQGARPANQCFYVNQMEGWRALDDKTIYVRANLKDVYRLDMSGSCPALTDPDAHLITKTRGSDLVCSALDWDLKVADSGRGSIPTPCIVGSMRKLTPAEAAAIPKKYRP